MALVAFARILVRLLPFYLWRGSLGTVVSVPNNSTKTESEIERANYWARRVLRATRRLPGNTKCLPQAVALQWLLARYLSSSLLVIGAHRSGADQENGLHAWVEFSGKIVIGHCDRDQYAPIAMFMTS